MPNGHLGLHRLMRTCKLRHGSKRRMLPSAVHAGLIHVPDGHGHANDTIISDTKLTLRDRIPLSDPLGKNVENT